MSAAPSKQLGEGRGAARVIAGREQQRLGESADSLLNGHGMSPQLAIGICPLARPIDGAAESLERSVRALLRGRAMMRGAAGSGVHLGRSFAVVCCARKPTPLVSPRSAPR